MIDHPQTYNEGFSRPYREFYLPARRKLPQKRKFRCRHCGASYWTEYVVDCCWPDRKAGEDRGLVVLCTSCGCRQKLEDRQDTTKTVGADHGTRGTDKSHRKWSRWLIPLAAFMLMALLGYSITVRRAEPHEHVLGLGSINTDNVISRVEDPSYDIDDAELIVPEQTGEIGNLFINISEGGLMQIVGDRVYYTNPLDEFRIYSMDLNFEDSRLECDIPSFYLNYQDNALIFSGADGGEKNLFRMELDSGTVSKLSGQSTYEPKVVGDTIYYDDVDEKYSLYRCDLDGDRRKRISPGVVFYSCIVGDKIYYLDTQDDYHLYSMDLDGGNKQMLLNQSARELSVQGDILYISLRDGGIMAYEIDSGETWIISDLSVSSLVAANDGWLYFSNLDNDGCLYKMSAQGDELTKLSSDPAAFINVVSNLISYQNKDTEQFYWILTDGSYYQQIQ